MAFSSAPYRSEPYRAGRPRPRPVVCEPLGMDKRDPAAGPGRRGRRTSWWREQWDAFDKARKVEHWYARQLRKIAYYIANLVSVLWHSGEPPAVIQAAINRYEQTLTPWAKAVASRMVDDVNKRDMQAWRDHAAMMGYEVKKEIFTAPTGLTAQKLIDDQVTQILSLPRYASDQVGAAAIKYGSSITKRTLYTGERSTALAREIESEILGTGHHARVRATLIARTETARAQTAFTKARAQYAGSKTFVWLTSNDGNVRESHRRLNNKIFSWDDPPITDVSGGKTYRSLPGCIWNCRCVAIPQFSDDD